eukprot:g1611.t1
MISGKDFRDEPPIVVLFSQGNKQWFKVTDPAHCICFGPALLSGAAAGEKVSYVIQTRDEEGVDRTVGGDKFDIQVVELSYAARLAEENDMMGGEPQESPTRRASVSGKGKTKGEAKDAPEEKEIEGLVRNVQVDDLGNGKHIVSFVAPFEGKYEITTNFAGSFGGESGAVGVPIKVDYVADAPAGNNSMSGPLMMKHLKESISESVQFLKVARKGLGEEVAQGNRTALLRVKEHLMNVRERAEELNTTFDVTNLALKHLEQQESVNVESEMKLLGQAKDAWVKVEAAAPAKALAIKPVEKNEGSKLEQQLNDYTNDVKQYEEEFLHGPKFWSFDVSFEEAVKEMDQFEQQHRSRMIQFNSWKHMATIFEQGENVQRSHEMMARVGETVGFVRGMWEVINTARHDIDATKDSLWADVDPNEMEDDAKGLQKRMRALDKAVRQCKGYLGLNNLLKDYLITIPLVAALRHHSMRPRHWDTVMTEVGKKFTPPHEDPDMKLSVILDLQLHNFVDAIEEVADQSVKEAKMEATLAKLSETWAAIEWYTEPYAEGDTVMLLKMLDDDFEMLENDQLGVQSMMGSRYLKTFEEEVTKWQKELGMVADSLILVTDVQRAWSYLEPLFIKSDEVKRELPQDAKNFAKIDKEVRAILKDSEGIKNITKTCNKDGLYESLEDLQGRLDKCMKSLSEFLAAKQREFPRFYFVSQSALLDILSNGEKPRKVVSHITKVFLSTASLTLSEENDPATGRPTASEYIAGVGREIRQFSAPVPLVGKAEEYLKDLLEAQKTSLYESLLESLQRLNAGQERVEWLMHCDPRFPARPLDAAQIVLLVSGMDFTTQVEKAIDGNSLKDFEQVHRKNIEDLIRTTTKKMPGEKRDQKDHKQRIMCMITMDTHGRDVITKLIRNNVDDKTNFLWQSQLKPRLSPEAVDPELARDGGCALQTILDARFDYGYEYLGNGFRLVVTPLTDRIYVVATQALNLKMGCAPAGPAGTGKTETTKDLASALGQCIYVFNCAPEFDYNSLGNIFRGLAASGSWGCFDEFNRLIPEVLSVCSVQFKAVCDGIKAQVRSVVVQGQEVYLDWKVGAFITMNPGYLGRSELPEGLKALFRPMTVMKPDLVLICENFLMAQGFVTAKVLASKFYGLYSLLGDLLSKQLHYDWGLRAVKSVLVVAGEFKMADPDMDEQALLMRALRDFNTPKIVAQDRVIFFGLLTDLFPGFDPPRKVDDELEKVVEEACVERGLDPDPAFRLKIVQLEELTQNRHSVFVMGNSMCGKSECWRTLAAAKTRGGQKTKFVDINPKSIIPEELYGYITMATREWKDGLLSKTMRDLGQIPDELPKWIILDGDLDANWIESMNSVMDDNKMLTLASNERIPLKQPAMKMLFEIRDLVYASPATVSRAGMIYISDDSGSQWRSIYKSWVLGYDADEKIKAFLQELGDKYIADVLFEIKKDMDPLVPVTETTMVTSLLRMLEAVFESQPGLMKKVSKMADGDAAAFLERKFVFCGIWAFGCTLSDKDGIDYRKRFDSFWRSAFKSVKIPSRVSVFEVYLDPETDEFEPWTSSPYFKTVEYDSSTPMEQVTVPTPETCSVTYWMSLLVANMKPVMLVGAAGCGKTQLVMGLLADQEPEVRRHQVINKNFYTDSPALQMAMEAPLKKRTGTTFGPPGQAKLIYFIDDINLPEVDPYNTQSSIALMRQIMEYGHCYDRQKLMAKQIQDCQYMSCMNPTAGSFLINPRLQRHFVTFAVGFPGTSSLFTIYETFLGGHLKHFDEEVQAISTDIISGALAVHAGVAAAFKKSAVNFHYEFNIRHLSNVFQGLLVAKPANFTGEMTQKFVLLWLHESERVYGDRLVTKEALKKYNELAHTVAKKRFPALKPTLTTYFNSEDPAPLVFCHYTKDIQDMVYDQAVAFDTLTDITVKALHEYNETNATMPLVLFGDAIRHVARITRIILNPAGHALLVGVGGSGKQSLSKLAAYICAYTLSSIVISQTYGINDLKEDLQRMYHRAGVKEEGVAFLFTESQITNERFLVYINDLLASGRIPDLYDTEGQDEIINAVTKNVKAAGLVPERDICWDYFIGQVRKNLHVILCFSPNGDAFRNRAMKFPALVNCTVIDWFRAWPQEALLKVGINSLSEVDLGTDDVRFAIERFMPYSFETVQEACAKFQTFEMRQVYVTPKSFLELLNLYKTMLAKKKEESRAAIERLSNGLSRLKETSYAVKKIGDDLEVKLVAAEEKKTVSEGIAETVAREKAIVEEESAKAAIEEAKANKISTEVGAKRKDTEEDLAKALPAVENAMAALSTLNKKDLSNAKTMNIPPAGVEPVFSAVAALLATIEPKLVLTKKGAVKDVSWAASKKALLQDIAGFLAMLLGFKELVDDNKVPDVNFKEVRQYIELEGFDPEVIMSKNPAAAGLCSWVINIVIYRDIIVTVEPKKLALAAATAQLEAANTKLASIKAKVAELQAKLDKLTAEFNQANAEKQAAIDEVETGQKRLGLAGRLTTALASENVRWAENVVQLEADASLLNGDVLLASAFISYIGPFTKQYRDELIIKKWVPFLQGQVNYPSKDTKIKPIPMADDPSPLSILTDPAEIAKWNSQGLPSDRVSVENGSVLVNTLRWPLIIDPQLQGIKWVQEKEKDNNLSVVRLEQKDMLRKLEASMENGYSFLIENMGERIDAILSPVIARATIKRGRKFLIKLGTSEVELHPNFKLIMHTKLSNPHYPPEVQAEAALINFAITEAGLEDQLLAEVVLKERPDLAEEKILLVEQQNGFKIKIKELEDEILYKLATAEGDITSDVELIEGLENAKKISIDVEEKSVIARETEAQINLTSEKYRSVANRGALVFFLMSQMTKVHTYYIYSLAAYQVVFLRGIDLTGEPAECLRPQKSPPAAKEEQKAELDPDADPDLLGDEPEPEPEEAPAQQYTQQEIDAALVERCAVLRTKITGTVFEYLRRGMFEKDKLTISTILTFRILERDGQLSAPQLESIITAPEKPDAERPENLAHWLPVVSWKRIKRLEVFKEPFGKLGNEIMDNGDEWNEWFDLAFPETEKCPDPFKDIDTFARLQILRALRPDRLLSGLRMYVDEKMGASYVNQSPFDMKKAYLESSPAVPVFFVLFPGVDPTRDVEALGKEYDITTENKKFVNISMGQGQEEGALAAIDKYSESGGWVMLQNLHLMQSFLPLLERKLEVVADSAHEQFRCYISAEPPPFAYQVNMPESLMQSCIKVANEAPADIKSNLRAAWANFDQATIDASTKPTEFKANLMTLCFYHSVICGRRRFGQQGWSRKYPFNFGDLSNSASILGRYLEMFPETPWADLRYIFGQIMYGGHITDPWDRRCNETYLDVYVEPGIYSGMEIAEGFMCPDTASLDYEGLSTYIDEKLPNETPVLFRLHPNAEINYLTTAATDLFASILVLSGGAGGGGGGGGAGSATKKLVKIVEGYIERTPETFNMVVINKNAEPHLKEDDSPYVLVLIQELGYMNVLLVYMRETLEDLKKGLNGELNMSEAMEDLLEALSINQVVARRIQYPLDEMTTETHVSLVPHEKYETIIQHPEDGAYCHGIFIEGARWGSNGYIEDEDADMYDVTGVKCGGHLMESFLKDLLPYMPVLYFKAVPVKETWEAHQTRAAAIIIGVTVGPY